jgi:RNA 2',3'-cyclic 3'-phosphodiesterase
MIRSFIAIELPEDVREKISRIQAELKKSGADVKWVEPANIHLTLKFIGEQDQLSTDLISLGLEETLNTTRRYHVRISSLGAFPRITSPRVIWLGIDTGDAETKAIAGLIETKMAALGVPREERELSSHITIGRIRSSAGNSALSGLLETLQKKPQDYHLGFEVTTVTLFKSTLTGAGPLYDPIKEVHLKAI